MQKGRKELGEGNKRKTVDLEGKGIGHHKSPRYLETRVYACSYLPTIQIYCLNYKKRPNLRARR